jgi:DNA repair protein RadD
MIAMLRATMSSALHVQTLGRGTRMAPGKKNCLVLDFAGNVTRLGPVNDPVLPRPAGKKSGSSPAPIKYCDACGVINHATVRKCIACEAEFQFQVKYSSVAGNVEIVSGLNATEEIEWKVNHVFYSKIMTKTKLPALRVAYSCGSASASEIICFEHHGFPRHKAHSWWRHRSTSQPPNTVDEALARAKSLPNPKTIKVVIQPGVKYPQINHVQF